MRCAHQNLSIRFNYFCILCKILRKSWSSKNISLSLQRKMKIGYGSAQLKQTTPRLILRSPCAIFAFSIMPYDIRPNLVTIFIYPK